MVVEVDADLDESELPSVSIQNGRLMRRRISRDSVESRSEKNGRGPASGSGSGGSTEIVSP